MHVSLNPRDEAMVRQKVESGRYNDASEVVSEALKLMEQQDDGDRFSAAVAVGRADLERGDSTVWGPETSAMLRRQAEADERLGVPLEPDAID